MSPWLDRVRRRAPAIVALAAVVAGAAAVYSFTATKRYEARAELLVSPLPSGDRTFEGLGLPRGAPGAAAETAARLVRTPEIAEAVRAQLGLRGSVSSYRVDGSQLVAVVGKASSPARAAPPAEGFAGRLAVLTGLVATRDPTLEVATAAVPPGDPVWPRPWLVIPLAAVAALAVAT